MYMERNLYFKVVFDFWSCSHINTLAPPGIVYDRFLLTKHSSTCLTTPPSPRVITLLICEKLFTFMEIVIVQYRCNQSKGKFKLLFSYFLFYNPSNRHSSEVLWTRYWIVSDTVVETCGQCSGGLWT